MKPLVCTSIMMISLASFGLVACSGADEQGSSVASYEGGESGSSTATTSTDPEADSDREPAGYQLDSDVEGLEGQLLVKVIFGGGGAGEKCVKWHAKIEASDGLELVKLLRNEKHDEVKMVGETVQYNGKTVGGRDGAKLTAYKGDTLKITGTMKSCDGSKSIDLDIERPIEKSKYYTPVAWVEDNGRFTKDSGFLKVVIKKLNEKKKGGGSGSSN